MKRLFSLALALLLLTALLSGCGGTDPAQPEEKTWTDGVIRDGVYTNECLQLTFQIPEDWAQASQEETRSILGADPADKLTVYDVLLGTALGADRMYVICFDLSTTIGGSRVTEEELLRETLEGLEGESSIDSGEFRKELVCGQEYTAVDIGGDVLQRVLVRRIPGNKMVMMGIVSDSQGKLDYNMTHFTEDASTIPAPPVSKPVDGNGLFSRGVISGGTYTSDYLGLSFTPPEDWVYASDAELAELMGTSFDMIGQDVYGDKAELAKEFAKQSVIYDMVAAAPDGSNIQIVLENLAKSIGGTQMSTEEYADILYAQLGSITDFEYSLGEISTDRLADKLFTVLSASVPEYDMQQQFWLLRVDDYMLCITFTSLGEDLSAFADFFTFNH